MPSTTTYAIREIEPVATDELLELVRLGLGAGSVPRTREFWNWKHVDNPFGPSYALVAEADGRLVGLRMFLRWRFRAGEREIAAVRAVDTVTHPDWQGRGIFTRLTLALLERVERDGVAFVFNTPNRASRAGYLKMGWRDVGRVPVLVKPLRPWRMLFGGGRSTRETAGEREGDRISQHLDHELLPGTVPVAELLSSEAAGALQASPPAEACRIQTSRSTAYLRWRYQAIPDIEYRAKWSEQGNAAGAAIVRLRQRRGRRELSISELLETRAPHSPPVTAALLSELADRGGIDYVATSAPADEARLQALRRCGFRAIPTGTPWLTARPLATTTPDPTNWSSWSLSTGDLELF